MKYLLPLFLVACAKPSVPPVPTPQTHVRMQAVDRTPVVRTVKTSGLLAAKQEMNLSFKVGGVLAGVYATQGARVKKGQLLAKLDPTEIAAGVQQARDGMQKAQRDYERLKGLHEAGQVATADFQNATTGLSVSQATLAAAEFNQSHSVITAPDDGWIDLKRGEVGEVVGPGQPIFHLSGRARGWVVRVSLSDRDVVALNVGQAARVRLDVEPSRLLAARVSEVAHSASPLTGTFEVELSLEDSAPTLRSGMVAKAELDLPTLATARVPLSALVQSRGLDADVFVLAGDTAKRTPIRLLFLSGDSAAVASGLDGIERVVTEGSAQLSDGEKVVVR